MPIEISWLTPVVRRWIYGIWLAVSPLLVLYGIMGEEAAPLWTTLVGSILVPGVAVLHTDTKTPTGMPRKEYAERYEYEAE